MKKKSAVKKQAVSVKKKTKKKVVSVKKQSVKKIVKKQAVSVKKMSVKKQHYSKKKVQVKKKQKGGIQNGPNGTLPLRYSPEDENIYPTLPLTPTGRIVQPIQPMSITQPKTFIYSRPTPPLNPEALPTEQTYGIRKRFIPKNGAINYRVISEMQRQ